MEVDHVRIEMDRRSASASDGGLRAHGARAPDRPVTLRAAVFDLDGVITRTAHLHAAAWKETFDAFLRARADREDEPFRPFEEEDYLAHVDGRPRLEGVRAFLASRGIDLPDGGPQDPPGGETVRGLGERKNARFRELLAERGADIDPEAVRLVRELRERGIAVGVASSSKNCQAVLRRAGLEHLYDARVDGLTSERRGLRGKPNPDIFLACIELLGVSDPRRAMVVEDAGAGVRAAREGGFGLVLGVDRGGNRSTLRESGADWIVGTFAGLSAERVVARFEAESRAYRARSGSSEARAADDGAAADEAAEAHE